MFNNKKEALANTKIGSGTNPSYTVSELIDSIYEFGMKPGWYKDVRGTVFNIVEIAVSAQRDCCSKEANLKYLSRVARNINWLERKFNVVMSENQDSKVRAIFDDGDFNLCNDEPFYYNFRVEDREGSIVCNFKYIDAVISYLKSADEQAWNLGLYENMDE